MLYFFYDQQQETWGFDPEDKGSWHVLYTPKSNEECFKRAAPTGLGKDAIYGGMLYFWIKKTDLEQARFKDCWMILQCS